MNGVHKRTQQCRSTGQILFNFFFFLRCPLIFGSRYDNSKIYKLRVIYKYICVCVCGYFRYTTCITTTMYTYLPYFSHCACRQLLHVIGIQSSVMLRTNVYGAFVDQCGRKINTFIIIIIYFTYKKRFFMSLLLQ
jgi:hypothetical protein